MPAGTAQILAGQVTSPNPGNPAGTVQHMDLFTRCLPDLPLELVATFTEISKADVRTASEQIVSQLRDVLERLEKDKTNQKIYAELRRITSIAVSLCQPLASQNIEGVFQRGNKNTELLSSVSGCMYVYVACKVRAQSSDQLFGGTQSSSAPDFTSYLS